MLVRVPLRVLGVALLMSVSACSRMLHLEIPIGTSVQLITFPESPSTTLVESTEITLQPDAPEYRRLQEWLLQNQRGWSQSLATNPSGGIIVRAGKLSLQFVDGAVFTWTDKGQFQKRIREEDYAFLKKPAGI
jgi:hypothetical protein